MERTRRTLHVALLELVQERGWREVTVLDVCARANVGRSTFYAHFADKEELLVSGFDLLRAQLRDAAERDDRPRAFVAPLIEHVRDHWPLMRTLLGDRSSAVVQRRLLEVVVERLDAEVTPAVPPGPERDALLRFVAGGLLELLTSWLETRSKVAPADLAATFDRFARRLLD